MHKLSRLFITCLVLLFACTLVSTPHAATAASFFAPRTLLSEHTLNSSAILDNTTGLFTLKILMPGSSINLNMQQNAKFPLGCPHLFILTIGTGTLTITLQKDDISGDDIFMFGLAISGAGTAYMYKSGVSKGLITKSVELGSESQPYGFMWIYSGIVYSKIEPKYAYTILLSFEK